MAELIFNLKPKPKTHTNHGNWCDTQPRPVDHHTNATHNPQCDPLITQPPHPDQRSTVNAKTHNQIEPTNPTTTNRSDRGEKDERERENS